ncbi:uncharacterized protein [Clytia hemisphaerica]|uniref:uncharacterized protein n=1 Tax=Clytia hemisphaerica TaxID=252671 RepID=UPI0034D4B13E
MGPPTIAANNNQQMAQCNENGIQNLVYIKTNRSRNRSRRQRSDSFVVRYQCPHCGVPVNGHQNLKDHFIVVHGYGIREAVFEASKLDRIQFCKSRHKGQHTIIPCEICNVWLCWAWFIDHMQKSHDMNRMAALSLMDQLELKYWGQKSVTANQLDTLGRLLPAYSIRNSYQPPASYHLKNATILYGCTRRNNLDSSLSARTTDTNLLSEMSRRTFSTVTGNNSNVTVRNGEYPCVSTDDRSYLNRRKNANSAIGQRSLFLDGESPCDDENSKSAYRTKTTSISTTEYLSEKSQKCNSTINNRSATMTSHLLSKQSPTDQEFRRKIDENLSSGTPSILNIGEKRNHDSIDQSATKEIPNPDVHYEQDSDFEKMSGLEPGEIVSPPVKKSKFLNECERINVEPEEIESSNILNKKIDKCKPVNGEDVDVIESREIILSPMGNSKLFEGDDERFGHNVKDDTDESDIEITLTKRFEIESPSRKSTLSTYGDQIESNKNTFDIFESEIFNIVENSNCIYSKSSANIELIEEMEFSAKHPTLFKKQSEKINAVNPGEEVVLRSEKLENDELFVKTIEPKAKKIEPLVIQNLKFSTQNPQRNHPPECLNNVLAMEHQNISSKVLAGDLEIKSLPLMGKQNLFGPKPHRIYVDEGNNQSKEQLNIPGHTEITNGLESGEIDSSSGDLTKNANENDDPWFHCLECGSQFLRKHKLVIHLRKEHGLKHELNKYVTMKQCIKEHGGEHIPLLYPKRKCKEYICSGDIFKTHMKIYHKKSFSDLKIAKLIESQWNGWTNIKSKDIWFGPYNNKTTENSESWDNYNLQSDYPSLKCQYEKTMKVFTSNVNESLYTENDSFPRIDKLFESADSLPYLSSKSPNLKNFEICNEPVKSTLSLDQLPKSEFSKSDSPVRIKMEKDITVTPVESHPLCRIEQANKALTPAEILAIVKNQTKISQVKYKACSVQDEAKVALVEIPKKLTREEGQNTPIVDSVHHQSSILRSSDEEKILITPSTKEGKGVLNIVNSIDYTNLSEDADCGSSESRKSARLEVDYNNRFQCANETQNMFMENSFSVRMNPSSSLLIPKRKLFQDSIQSDVDNIQPRCQKESQLHSKVVKDFVTDVENVATMTKIFISKAPELESKLTSICKEVLKEMSQPLKQNLASNYQNKRGL